MRKHSVRFHSMFCEVASKALIAGSSSRNREPALRRRLRPYIVLLDQQRPRNRLQANGLHFTTDQSPQSAQMLNLITEGTRWGSRHRSAHTCLVLKWRIGHYFKMLHRHWTIFAHHLCNAITYFVFIQNQLKYQTKVTMLQYFQFSSSICRINPIVP